MDELDKKNASNISTHSIRKDDLQKILNNIDNILKIDDSKSKTNFAWVNDVDTEISKIEKIISSTDDSIIIHNGDYLISQVANSVKLIKSINEDKSLLMNQSLSINFKKLYDATIELKDNYKEMKCPLCDTPFDKVSTNPFEKAEDEISKLKGISEIQERIEKTESEIEENYDELKSIFNQINNNIKGFEVIRNLLGDVTTDLKFYFTPEKSPNLNDKILFLNSFISFQKNNETNIQSYFSNISKYAIEKETQKKNLIKNQDRLDELRKAKINLNNLFDSKLAFEKEISTLDTVLSDYNTKKLQIETEIINEEQKNLFIESVEQVYKIFRDEIESYKRQLEKEEISGIALDTKIYYQYINKHDKECEQIQEVKFDMPENATNCNIILINNSNIENKATTLLSEGHLRVLGLAIILALAKKRRLPFIVFDDVVNAIDTDHRSNIIELFFNDIYLKKTQLIITTHDRLFWEKFCNCYKSRCNANDLPYISYVLDYTNTGTIPIRFGVGFIEKIQEAIRNFDIRQALIYCRIHFETLIASHCIKKQYQVKVKLTHRNKFPFKMPKPTLESLYSFSSPDFNENTNYHYLKDNLITWSSLNQEHHAFDEESYNLIHSKTSDEVQAIYEALIKFENDISQFSY